MTHARLAALILLPCALASCRGAAAPRPPRFGRGVRVAGLAAGGIWEASGMACSRRAPGLLWLLNDSGGGAFLHCVTRDGRVLGKVLVRGARNVDWEDLAAFTAGGRHYLLIADVGDNAYRRRHCVLYVLEEPVVDAAEFPKGAEATVLRAITFAYEDGPRDCEAVAVDPEAGRVILIEKRPVPPGVYAVPLNAVAGTTVKARRIGDLRRLPQPTWQQKERYTPRGRFGSQVSGLDISSDGRFAVVLTYRNAYRYVRKRDEPLEVALERYPDRIPLPKLRQAEAVGLTPDGRTLFVASEKRPGDLVRFDAGP